MTLLHCFSYQNGLALGMTLYLMVRYYLVDTMLGYDKDNIPVEESTKFNIVTKDVGIGFPI